MTEPARPAIRLAPTTCAICGTLDNSDQLYPPTFGEASFNEQVFSARRAPDAIHYRIVRCRACGLVRSDPAADQASLSGLYERSSLDYGAEIPNLRRTYGRYLERARRRSGGKSLLEIGCGNGFMLEEALAQGYESIRGVEPSREAIGAAAPAIRDRIAPGVMAPGQFTPGEFDTVCMFQVFDHLPEPGNILDQVRTLLGAGGVLLCFNHNVESMSARLLGERSPIIDIEHCFLYSPSTMRTILERHGFKVVECGPAINTVSIRHLVHLLPVTAALRPGLQAAGSTRIGQLAVRLPLGNLYVVAVKS
ncbi:MAG TPA: class I SAM-dependent methyltransferase [Candidatus Dormibacteraeota bacterium]|nr:class I SAM-dependent methyltransferase [Candidatus Dormibacteraeota bacterium]